MDYTNAVAQVEIKEEVYIEGPKEFQRKDKRDLVLKLFKTIYGLRQAPNSFFDKISERLIERGFVQSEIDTFLFMKEDLI